MQTELNPATPIWIAHETTPNTWGCFRHSFDLPEAAGRSVARISVDSKYWLWVNGNLIVREGGLKRGPNPVSGYIDEVDLTANLLPGRNTLALLVWHFGLDGASHRCSGRGYLKLQIALDSGLTIETNRNWRALRHPAFLDSEQRPTLNGKVLLSEHAIEFDARRDISEWTGPSYDDSAWEPAVELERAAWDLGDQLRPIGFWQDGEMQRYDNDAALELPRTGPCELVGRLPANIHVYPWLQVRAGVGEAIKIQVERHKFYSTYHCREGENAFEVPAWGNGHWVRYEIPAGVTVEALGYRQTMYPLRETGVFDSSEEWMTRLWRKAVTTQLVCMRDSFMDCPDRERAPWPGDYANMMEFVGYALGDSGMDLARKSFTEFTGWRTGEGILWGPTPTGRYRDTYREFPAQSLATIAIGLRDFWWQSGDLSFLKAIYPAVRDYVLKVCHMEPDGHVPHRGPWEVGWDEGTQSWYDWGTELDLPLMDHAWYGCALQAMAEFAEASGDINAAKECRERHGRGTQFLRSWWDTKEGAYRSPDFPHAPDPRGNALAVLAGMAPTAESVVRCLSERETNTIYMEKHVIDALILTGHADLALARIERRYAADLQSPYSTLPEGFGQDANHAWGVGPAAALVREVVGLRPSVAGWGKFVVRPADIGVEHCSARIPTPIGFISATIRRVGGDWYIRVESPEGALGTLELPVRFSRVEVSGANAEKSEAGWKVSLPTGPCEVIAIS